VAGAAAVREVRAEVPNTPAFEGRRQEEKGRRLDVFRAEVPPTSSPPPSTTSHRKASRPSATTASTRTKAAACRARQRPTQSPWAKNSRRRNLPSSRHRPRPRPAPCGRFGVTSSSASGARTRSKCPCCKATMKVADTFFRPGEIEFFLRLHGLWEGVTGIPPPPDPPFDIEKRRGTGGVLDAGEAGARRVSPPHGAGESNFRAHRAALAGHPRMDSGGRSGPGLRLFRPAPRIRPDGRSPPRRRFHPRPRSRLISPASGLQPAKKLLGKAERIAMLENND
jgi:hypothetical protein